MHMRALLFSVLVVPVACAPTPRLSPGYVVSRTYWLEAPGNTNPFSHQAVQTPVNTRTSPLGALHSLFILTKNTKHKAPLAPVATSGLGYGHPYGLVQLLPSSVSEISSVFARTQCQYISGDFLRGGGGPFGPKDMAVPEF